jgi:hypothetical protein
MRVFTIAGAIPPSAAAQFAGGGFPYSPFLQIGGSTDNTEVFRDSNGHKIDFNDDYGYNANPLNAVSNAPVLTNQPIPANVTVKYGISADEWQSPALERQTITLQPGKIISSPFKTDNDPTRFGRFNFFEYQANRKITTIAWISLTPGGPPLVGQKKASASGLRPDLRWAQFPTDKFINLTPNTQYYVNAESLSSSVPSTVIERTSSSTGFVRADYVPASEVSPVSSAGELPASWPTNGGNTTNIVIKRGQTQSSAFTTDNSVHRRGSFKFTPVAFKDSQPIISWISSSPGGAEIKAGGTAAQALPTPSNVIYAADAGIKNWTRYAWDRSYSNDYVDSEQNPLIPEGKILSLRFETDGNPERLLKFTWEQGGIDLDTQIGATNMGVTSFEMRCWISLTPGGPAIPTRDGYIDDPRAYADGRNGNYPQISAADMRVNTSPNDFMRAVMPGLEFDENGKRNTGIGAVLDYNTVYYMNQERLPYDPVFDSDPNNSGGGTDEPSNASFNYPTGEVPMMNGRFFLIVVPVGFQGQDRWVDSTKDAVVFTQYPSEHVSLNRNTTYYINAKHSTSTKNTDMKRIMSTQDNRTPQTTAAIYAQEQAANVPGTYTGYYESPIPSNVIYAKEAGVEDWSRYRWGDRTVPYQASEQDTVKVPNGKIASLRFETDGDDEKSFAFFAQVGGFSYVKFKMKMWISRTPGGPPIAQNIRKNIRDKNATPVFIEGNLSTGLIMKCSQFDWNARFDTSHWVAALQLNTVYYVNYERVAGNQPSEPFMHGRWFIKYMSSVKWRNSVGPFWIEGKPTATPGQTYPVPEPESINPQYDNLSYTKPITRAQWESDADVVSEVTYVDKAGILVTEFTASGLPGWGKSFKHEYVSSSYNGRDENMRYRAWITSKPGGPAITQCLNRKQNSGDVINVRMADLEGGNECRVFPGKTYYLCVQTVRSTLGVAKTVTRTMSTLNNTNALQDAERDVVLASDPVLVRDDILTRAVMLRRILLKSDNSVVDVDFDAALHYYSDHPDTPNNLSITAPDDKTISIEFETDNDDDREGRFHIEGAGLSWNTWISLTPGGPPIANSSYNEGSSVLDTMFVTGQDETVDAAYAGRNDRVILPVSTKLYFNVDPLSLRVASTWTFSLFQTKGIFGRSNTYDNN